MDIRVEIGPWTFSAGLWQTRDLEDELDEDGDLGADDDEGRTHAGAADRGLDLSTERDTTDRAAYDAGTVIEQDDRRRTGFHA